MMPTLRTRAPLVVVFLFWIDVGLGASACSSGGRTEPSADADGSGAASDGDGLGGSSASGGQKNGMGGLFGSGTAGAFGAPGAPGSSGAGTATGAACNNGKDDDGDGLVDGFDPECTGPFDDDEGSFATGIPGDNRDPKWQDCFFDGNSGAGDDGCRYHTDCLYGKLPPDDPSCRVTEQCLKFCRPLTQNGCDCFGCCTIELGDGSTVDVVEVSTCSLANIGDAKACPRCTQNRECSNECGECELCPGKTTLPASCNPSPPTGAGGAPGAGGAGNLPPPPLHACDNGEQVCGPNLPPCANAFEYCSFGCCIASVR